MKKYSVYFWVFITLAFLAFIGTMSYWYPVTIDEYFKWQEPAFQLEKIKNYYLYIIPRISVFWEMPVFALGKWSFVLVNSLIQLINCLCIFYIVFVRLPDTKSYKDMPYFLIILCMSVFFVCRPSEVIFWISGATNYSWTITAFLIMICFLRQIYAHKFIFTDIWIAKLLFFILGFIVGMTNESVIPIALGGTVCFALFCNFKGIKTPKSLSFLIFGLAAGCLVFFAAPAHYNKMLINGISNISAVSIWQKLFFHLYHFNNLFMAQFFLPIITGLLLFLAVIDIRNVNFKTDAFCGAVIFFILAFLIAFILFIVPQPPLRAYYPASMIFIISFLFLVRYYIEIYKFDFSKILCFIIIGISLYFVPRFVYPHYYLHIQEKARNAVLAQSPDGKVRPYTVLKGPTSNLSIGFTDPARKVELDEGVYITDVSPLTNW